MTCRCGAHADFAHIKRCAKAGGFLRRADRGEPSALSAVSSGRHRDDAATEGTAVRAARVHVPEDARAPLAHRATPESPDRVARTERDRSTRKRAAQRTRFLATVHRSRAPGGRGGSRRNDWRPEEIEFLVRTHTKLTAREQAKQLGRDYWSVVSCRGRLARDGRIDFAKRAYMREWTEAEEERLASMLGRIPLEEISRRLNRSLNALHVHMVRNGFRQRDGAGLSARAVAEIFGLGDFHPERTWVAWGYLAGKKSIIRAGSHPGTSSGGASNLMWSFDEADVVRFIREHPEQYDRRRITHPYYRRIADEVHRQDPLVTPKELAKELGLKDAKGAHHLVIHYGIPHLRRGGPGRTGRSLSGQHILIRRSVVDAFKATWKNYRVLARDRELLTAGRAANLLFSLPDRPRWIRMPTLLERAYTYYRVGAIATQLIDGLGKRKPWRVAKREEILALKPAFFRRPVSGHGIWPHPEQLERIRRHDPSWLERPRELALAMADGRMRTLLEEWKRRERPRRLRQAPAGRPAKHFVLVTQHIARILGLLRGRTRLVYRLAVYHTRPCQRGLVSVPRSRASAHRLRICPNCRRRRRSMDRAA